MEVLELEAFFLAFSHLLKLRPDDERKTDAWSNFEKCSTLFANNQTEITLEANIKKKRVSEDNYVRLRP